MERTPWRSKPRAAFPRMRTKVSYGVILMRKNPATGKPEAVLERGRYTYEFSEFVHGRYSRKNLRAIAELFACMTLEEKLDVLTLDFSQMWRRIWLDVHHTVLYNRKLAKFQSSWLRDDGGTRLCQLVRASTTQGSPNWEIPKGRRESGSEANILCAVREFTEETGIPKNAYRILPNFCRRISYVHMGTRYNNVYYAAVARRDIHPRVSLSLPMQVAEVAEVRWMDIEHIRLIDTPSKRLEATVAPAFSYFRKYLKGQI